MTNGTEDPFKMIRRLYHFTDKRNLNSIREVGGLFPLELLGSANIQVAAPGGDENSQATDRANRLDTYVHLCLHKPHPMAVSAQTKGRLGKVEYLEIDRGVLHEAGVLFVPGMSNTRGIGTYALADAVQQGMLADVETLYQWISWRLFPEARERRVRAEKFEILIPGLIPIERILNMPND